MTLKSLSAMLMQRFCLSVKQGWFSSSVFFCHKQSMKLGVVLGGSIILQACASYGQHAVNMRDGLLMGHPEMSLAIAEKTDPDQEEVISSLDKGMLRRMNNDFTGSNKILEIAKQEIEKLHGISITENLASVTINETLRGYEGDPYEQLLLHAYMAMNYIQLGQFDEARVEMLQANVKMMEWGDEPEEDAYLRYLEGIIYENLGEYDNALISYRKAYIVYKEKGEQYPAIPDSLKKDLLRLTAREGLRSEYEAFKKEFGMPNFKPAKVSNRFGELIVILNNGLAPIRYEASIYIFSSEVQQNLRVAFPVYRDNKKRLSKPVIKVAGKQYAMETVEDVDKLARHALSEAMPGIMVRATARAVVKYNTQHTAQDNSSFAGLLMTVTNLVTERADTRSWSTLPQEIQLRRIDLPAGEHQVQLQLLNAAGQLVDTINETVIIKPKKSSFVIKHWVAPVPKISRQKTEKSNS
ncbi:MAG: COG3014 family protein [Gammaproteobacteria bacterium]